MEVNLLKFEITNLKEPIHNVLLFNIAEKDVNSNNHKDLRMGLVIGTTWPILIRTGICCSKQCYGLAMNIIN